ncbi:hypothetical protein QCA50_011440 [Cerrena zonata]|uniref:F-box domain-containing protein n=1 Tax=Cerrena zonata TaxID=2478898 RepID=A0AAW0FX01_9APHY
MVEPTLPTHDSKSSGMIEQRSFASEIPIELVEYIIDHLHDDTLALCSSSLVCRSWTEPARHHLFYEVKVHSNKKEYASGNLFTKLHDILDTGRAVHPHIKRLFIEADPTMNQLLSATLLRACFDHLTSVHTLSVRGVRFPRPRAGDADSDGPAPQVRTLLVKESVTDDGFLSTVGHLRSLQKLVMEDMNRFTMKLNTTRFNRPHLTSLLLDDADAPTLAYFLTPDRTQDLESLTLVFRQQPSLRTLQHLSSMLHLPDIKLNYLSIQVGYGSPGTPLTRVQWKTLELHSCSTLISLRVVIDLTGAFHVSPDHRQDIDTEWDQILPQILPQSHSGIRHFELGLHYSYESLRQLTQRMKNWDWKPLQTALSRWNALQTVTFNHLQVNRKAWTEEWEEMVRGQLTALPMVCILFQYTDEAEDRAETQLG